MKKDVILRLLSELEDMFGDITIIEIGTIRNTSEAHAEGDGHSTRYIAEYVRDAMNTHTFHSVDIKPDVCRKYLKELKLDKFVKLHRCAGADFLETFTDVAHLIYLDGENDAHNTLVQFLHAREILVDGGIILIDDCFPESTEVVKAHEVLKHLVETKQHYEIENNMLIYMTDGDNS